MWPVQRKKLREENIARFDSKLRCWGRRGGNRGATHTMMDDLDDTEQVSAAIVFSFVLGSRIGVVRRAVGSSPASIAEYRVYACVNRAQGA